jgi:gamma-glutamyltranspeptidase / glutathione hydrolase
MPRFTTRPEILGTFGVVTSTHWLATAAGMSILEKGGNAFDAAVATGFALQMVEPHLNGPAGEVPLILSAAGSNEVKVICGQGSAPGAATIGAYRDLGLDLVPGTGLLSAVVPGAFDAWMLLLRDYGTMTVEDVLTPALGFAETGYPLVRNISKTIESMKQTFEDDWPTSAAVYLPNGEIPQPGTLFRNPGVAAMYRRIITEAAAAGGNREARIEAARRVWSQGFVAEAIDRFCRENEVMDVSGERHRGLLTGDDMARWQATYEDPLTYDYHGFTVCKTGPWGQGPAFLQQLALLAGFDFSAMTEESPEFVHTVIECSKLAFADREAFYGDPDFVDVPVDVLLSDAYNEARRALVGEQASFELRPGDIPGFGGKVVVREVSEGGGQGAGEPTVARFDEAPAEGGAVKGDTVHFDIIDRFGNMITGTPSGGWLQSSPVIPELGFALTSRAQMFWLEEGLPGSLAPNKRPRTTLTPSLALRDGEPYMVFGTPGGDQQDQWSLHLFLRHVHFGLNLQESIDAPGFQTAHFPSSFYPREADPGQLTIEGRFPAETADDLRRRGHNLTVDDDWCLERMTAAAKDGDLLKAAANPRFMQGYAIGR